MSPVWRKPRSLSTTYSSAVAGGGLRWSRPSSRGRGTVFIVVGRGAGVTWSLLTRFSSPSMSMTNVEASASASMTTKGPMALLCSLFCRSWLVVYRGFGIMIRIKHRPVSSGFLLAAASYVHQSFHEESEHEVSFPAVSCVLLSHWMARRFQRIYPDISGYIPDSAEKSGF